MIRPWKITRTTHSRIFDNVCKKDAYKAFRNSSSAYIARKDVRDFIFKRDGSKCYCCGSTENLEIDHLKSVIQCFKDGLIYFCNTLVNLGVLCSTCNRTKLP